MKPNSDGLMKPRQDVQQVPELGGGEIPHTTAPREHDRGFNVDGSKKAGKPWPTYQQHKLIAMTTRKSANFIQKNAALLTVIVTSCFFSRYLRLFIF